MKKYLETLKACPLFDGVEENDILKMLSCLDAKVMEFDKKYTIFTEGSPAKYIGIMLFGSAQIIQHDYYGNRSIISEITSPDLFGEAFASMESQSIPISVIANEACEVMLISANSILHTCSNSCLFHQKIIFNLMKSLAEKNILFHQKIDIISKRTTRDKLMTYLMYEAKKVRSGKFKIPFDRQELADFLEVDRSGLSAEISKLRREKVLTCRKNQFELL